MKTKNKLEQLREAIGGFEKSNWVEETHKHQAEESWRRKSQQIAFRILRNIRSKGMSQQDLAIGMNISPQQISKWVRGSENFTLETISKIETALAIELIEIIKTPEMKSTKFYYLHKLSYNSPDFEYKGEEITEDYAICG